MDASFDHELFANASCAFGVFDGVHTGHRFLLDCARKTAQESQGRSVALTFDIDPDEVFHPQRLKKLMTNEHRLLLLSRCGVDAVVVLAFTRQFASHEPRTFLEQTFKHFLPAFLHVGYDIKFGARTSGTVRDLDAWGKLSGTCVLAHGLKTIDALPVSATRIRLLLEQGSVEEANRLLGRPYSLTGKVLPGRGEGADMGFRTANLQVSEQLRTLGDGVYAGWACVVGARYKAAINMGVAASFADRSTATCEVHLLDFEGDLYGMPIKVEFLHRLRSMRVFDDIDELIGEVKRNISWIRTHL